MPFLSIKEATRIRVDGAPITNVFGNIYSTNCGGRDHGRRAAATPVHRRRLPRAW
jgi:hypothetical protein